MDNCVFSQVCKTPNCEKLCTLRMEFDYLVDNSDVPINFRQPKKLYPEECDLEAFTTLDTIKKDIVRFVEDGRFLYLWSSATGVGKSQFVCKMIMTYLAMIANYNGFNENNGALFCYVPELVLKTTDFKDDNREAYLKALCERKLVIFDDIGAVSAGRFAETNLSSIIDMRYRNKLATIFTSNLTEQGLENVIGARMADRILSDIVINLKGSGRRTNTNLYLTE